MNNPHSRIGAVFLLLIAMGASSSKAIAQDQELFRRDNARNPEAKPSLKLDRLYRFSRVYLVAGTGLDMFTTVQVMKHPTIASRDDGSVLANFRGEETGWAGSIGKRNTAAVVIANVALNAGIDFLSRRMYRRGGHWRILAIALNVAKGSDNMLAGVHNIRYNAGLNARIRQESGYAGPVIWSH